MIDKPTGSVSPYSHLTSASMRLNEKPVQSNISPRLTPSSSILSQSSRTGTAIERLDSLLGSPTPRSDSMRQSTPKLTTTPNRSQASTPTPNNRKSQSNYSTMSLPRPAQRTRVSQNFSPHGLTSTPLSSRDVATVNPIIPSSTPNHTPTRRDVPPEPSPIRPNINSDLNHSSSTYTSRTNQVSPQSNINTPRRPGTPTKPKTGDTSNDSEKSTLWFEYGCV